MKTSKTFLWGGSMKKKLRQGQIQEKYFPKSNSGFLAPGADQGSRKNILKNRSINYHIKTTKELYHFFLFVLFLLSCRFIVSFVAMMVLRWFWCYMRSLYLWVSQRWKWVLWSIRRLVGCTVFNLAVKSKNWNSPELTALTRTPPKTNDTIERHDKKKKKRKSTFKK